MSCPTRTSSFLLPQVEALAGIVAQLQGSPPPRVASLDASFDGPPRDQGAHHLPPPPLGGAAAPLLPADPPLLPGGRDVERLVPKLVEFIEDSHHKVPACLLTHERMTGFRGVYALSL